jgi:hypothetical protein
MWVILPQNLDLIETSQEGLFSLPLGLVGGGIAIDEVDTRGRSTARDSGGGAAGRRGGAVAVRTGTLLRTSLAAAVVIMVPAGLAQTEAT